jgi:hypothetical protein
MIRNLTGLTQSPREMPFFAPRSEVGVSVVLFGATPQKTNDKDTHFLAAAARKKLIISPGVCGIAATPGEILLYGKIK